MRRLIFTAISFVIVMGSIAFAQQITPMIAKPEDQAVIKPLVAAEKKAKETLDAKVAALPEAEALRRAQEAFNKAVEKLPEDAAWKEAGAQTIRAAYKLQAKYQLSSLEYEPKLNDRGDLVFSPKPKQ